MERQAIVIDGWPVLMSRELASRYLSIDEVIFDSLVEAHGVEAVELQPHVLRWRKVDLDRLTKRLPTKKVLAASNGQPDKRGISDAEIERLALAIARHMGSVERDQPPELMSIRDASRLLGLSRTTIYGLINENRLQTCQIGRRRLVLRSAITALMAEL